MAGRGTPLGLTEEELAQFEDVDLHEDEKEYVQASNEELEEENDDEDEYTEAREREAEGPAEYAQKWQAREKAAYPREEKKTQKEEEETRKEEKKTQNDGVEEAVMEKVTKEPASEVDEEVIDLDAHSNAVQ
jgi:hypothetical protein